MRRDHYLRQVRKQTVETVVECGPRLAEDPDDLGRGELLRMCRRLYSALRTVSEAWTTPKERERLLALGINVDDLPELPR